MNEHGSHQTPRTAEGAASRAQEHGHHDPAPATAAIAGHPIHPVLVPFPIAFLTAALLTDVVWWVTADAFWARGSFWLLAAGAVTGLLAALVGLVDFATVPRARQHTVGWMHLVGMSVVILLASVNALLRLGDQVDAILPWGLTLSVVTAGVLALAGWFGGELSYRHLIGTTGHD